MKTKGVINEFNGRYGTINMNNEIVDFSAKDISNNEKVQVGDLVEFRLEVKFPNIKIARNIKTLVII